MVTSLMTQLREKIMEPEWLVKKREAAKQAYQTEPLPDRVSHLWKYTDPQTFLIDARLSSKSIQNEFVNHEQSGLVILNINVALEKYSHLLKEKFGVLMEKSMSKLFYLNDSEWSGGYFIYVEKNAVIEKPLSVLFDCKDKNAFCPVRNFIYLDEGAEVNVIELLKSAESANSYINSVTEIFLEKKSKLNFAGLQLLDKTSKAFSLQRARLNDSSKLANVIVSVGGKEVKVELEADLIEKKAYSEVFGIVLGDESQKFDHHTTINHYAENTKSELNFRVVLNNKARSAYTGNLAIFPTAIKSDAQQENRNLLLSPSAKVESIPELEILTNDVVKCNHGVTVGQVDKDQIYYLMTRGFTEKDAEQLIVKGFFEPTLVRIPDVNLQASITEKIDEKLAKGKTGE